ncbi:MAG: molybdopterin-dependent oxidoreductase [Deltaproteobacteria bacterium]|nr:molybdopterin-dependent oxidoreductase [Deltaproteobacteria bacterium]
MAKITVDGVELEVPDNSMLLPVLLDRGMQIPHYCYHPKLSIDGSCRMCLVKVEGLPKLTISCNTPVRDGMVVDTRGPEVTKARQGVLELLLVNHPLDCPICDQAGECYLQDYAFEYGTRAARTQEPRRKLLKRVDVGPRVVLDQERCILCRRCIRFCKEVTETRELGVFNLGDRSVVDVFPDEPLANDYSICTADVCPVGALLSKDFHHKMRVWFLDETESVCPNCANGCNIKIGAARGHVHRLLPRRNDDVNETWMCDTGRLGYRFVNEHRLRAPRIRRDGVPTDASWTDALEAAATSLASLVRAHGPTALATIVSPHLTNEELFTLRQLMSGGLRSEQGDVAVIEGPADDFLIKAEKAANVRGARDLGLAAGGGHATLAEIRTGIEAGTIRALFVTTTDVWTLWGADAAALLDRLETVVVVAANEHPLLAHADVVLPGATFAEKNGTFTNLAGRVQRIHRALDPGSAPTDGEIFLQLGRRLGMEIAPGVFDPRAVFTAITRHLPAYGALAWDTLGANGASTVAA